MNIEQVLLWSTVFNYCLLILWWAIIISPHGWIYGLCKSKNFAITPEKFDQYNFIGVITYKLIIVFFNLIPYIALRIVMG